MTATGVVGSDLSVNLPSLTPSQIMAQLGMFVPARKARCVMQYFSPFSVVLIDDVTNRLCPVDAILTRMGAYDNMFSNASTFKVELDEWSVLYHSG